MTKPETFALAFGKASEPITFVSIPAGEFLMGSDESDPDAHSDEMPQHLVSLQGFSMSQGPITQAQWRAVAMLPLVDRKLDPDPSYFQGDELPVERVSWHDAIEFCARLSIKTRKPITLPSEAQWEYACRAGTTTAYAFGNALTKEMANFKSGGTTPVGSFPANSWGLYDMHGNVWEWCLDDYHASYEGAPTDGGAWVEGDSLGKFCAVELGRQSRVPSLDLPHQVPPCNAGLASVFMLSLTKKMLRGGCWFNLPRDCRSASHGRVHPDDRDDGFGFRVCFLPHG